MLASVLGWIGAALMVIAPPLIDTDAGKVAAATGLALLSVQAIDARLWNLLILNLAGIGGYIYALYF